MNIMASPGGALSDDGGELLVDRYLSGDEDYFRRSARRPSKVISVACEVTPGGDTEVGSTIRGAATAALIDWLQAAGYNVEVLAIDYSTGWLDQSINGRTDEASVVVVKSTGDQVDENTLGMCLANREFARSVVFRTARALDLRPGTPGCARSMPESVRQGLGVDVSCPPMAGWVDHGMPEYDLVPTPETEWEYAARCEAMRQAMEIEAGLANALAWLRETIDGLAGWTHEEGMAA